MLRAALLLGLLLLAGCVETVPDGDAEASLTSGAQTLSTPPSQTPSESASATPSPSCSQGHCDWGHKLKLFVYVDEPQPRQLAVPLPHGDWCIPPQDWAVEAAFNLTATPRTVDRGQVLWLETSGSGHVTASVDLAGRAACQTFRYDPWSVDPDPEDGAMPVNATAATALHAQVQEFSGVCYTVDAYDGTAGPGWTTLPRHDGGLACQ